MRYSSLIGNSESMEVRYGIGDDIFGNKKKYL